MNIFELIKFLKGLIQIDILFDDTGGFFSVRHEDFEKSATFDEIKSANQDFFQSDVWTDFLDAVTEKGAHFIVMTKIKGKLKIKVEMYDFDLNVIETGEYGLMSIFKNKQHGK